MKFCVLTFVALATSLVTATSNSTVPTSQPIVEATKSNDVPWADKTIKRLDLNGKFKTQLHERMDVLNRQFLKTSLTKFENYCTLETIQLIFDLNMDYKEFVYIFEDMWNYAAPHTIKIAKKMEESFDLRMDEDSSFLKELD